MDKSVALSPQRVDGKMRSIEAARALAAIIVVLMHAANQMRVENLSGHIGLGGIFDFGYIGVDFFFVLSGFIITYVHFAEIGHADKVPRYLWRRFSRIYPIYWVILAIWILTTLAARYATGKGVALDMGSADIAGTVFLLMGAGDPKYVGVAWSLQYEVVFYIAFCLLLVSARLGALVFGAWGLFVLARAFNLVHVELPLSLGSAHCLQFLFGVAVGVAGRRYQMRAPVMALVPVLVAFIAAVVFEVYGPFDRHSAEGRIALGLTSAAILATLVALENGRQLHTPAWLAHMGSVSYSIYLLHGLVLNIAYMAMLKFGIYHALPEVLAFGIAVGAALAVTTLVGKVIELPLVDALKERRPILVTAAAGSATRL